MSKDFLEPIESLEGIVDAATRAVLGPASALEYLRVIDALTRFNGAVHPDNVPDFGALKGQLALAAAEQVLTAKIWMPVVARLGMKLPGLDERGGCDEEDPYDSINEKNFQIVYKASGKTLPDSPGLRTRLLSMVLVWSGLLSPEELIRLEPFDMVWGAGAECQDWYGDVHRDSGGLFGAASPPGKDLFLAWSISITKQIGPSKPSFQLLSTPTHANFWLEPSVLVKRLNASKVDIAKDLSLAILRLAPHGRKEALDRMNTQASPTAELVRAALESSAPIPKKGDEDARHCVELLRAKSEETVSFVVPQTYWWTEDGASQRPNDFGLPDLSIASDPPESSEWDDSVGYLKSARYRFQPRPSSLKADLLLSTAPGRLDMIFTNLLSYYPPLWSWKSKSFVDSFETVMTGWVTQGSHPLPDSVTLFLALMIGQERDHARACAVKAISAVPKDRGFCPTSVGQRFAQYFNELQLLDPPRSLVSITNVAMSLEKLSSIDKLMATRAAEIAVGVLEIEYEPRGLNRLLDLITKVRKKNDTPELSEGILDWLSDFSGRSILATSAKNLLSAIGS